ncbi:MAG: hypothetical protein U0T85_01850 [Cloacibacterium normanense]
MQNRNFQRSQLPASPAKKNSFKEQRELETIEKEMPELEKTC